MIMVNTKLEKCSGIQTFRTNMWDLSACYDAQWGFCTKIERVHQIISGTSFSSFTFGQILMYATAYIDVITAVSTM